MIWTVALVSILVSVALYEIAGWLVRLGTPGAGGDRDGQVRLSAEWTAAIAAFVRHANASLRPRNVDSHQCLVARADVHCS